ncbi:MAG: DUF1638 domain-containing protein [Anaerolineae bacterium]|nr:DUF1638 domain-containing protein [Anaerolineae bacterium]
MHLKCLTCEALARPAYLCAARSPHTVDIELFRLGWHVDPKDLHNRLQEAIDKAAADPDRPYDAITMAYGLCGRSTDGLVARGAPLVIPRAHDCITLFLGGRERYQQEFIHHPGTYWYVRDYVERKGPGTALSIGAGGDGIDDIHDVYEDYVRKYGRDNADYLMEVMGAWRDHYNRAAYIDTGVVDSTDVEAETRAEAERRSWTFDRLTGDLVLIRRLLEGDWDEDFLILQPGQAVAMTYDERVVTCLG